MIRRIGFISCTHVGGSGALWPESHETVDGQTLLPSKEQLTIKQYWDDFVSREIKAADTVILLGDMVQGLNRKSCGHGLMISDLGEQVAAAVSLLKPVCEGRKVFSITGSAYHDSMDTSLDMAICKQLGGTFYGGLRTVDVKGTGKVLNICHGGASPTMYKATHEDRESMLLDAAIGAGNIRHPIDIIVRGHWHYYQALELGHRTLVRVPGWQAWYDAKFMRDMLGKKNNPMGAVCLDIGKDVEVRKRLYPPLEMGGNIGEV